MLHYLNQFFVEFPQLADRLSLETLDSGITGMFSEAHFQLQSVLWNDSLDLHGRIHCIRSMDDDRTKSCALHGLGHLHHPEVRSVVQEFIETRAAQFQNHSYITSQGLAVCESGGIAQEHLGR
jgi:hypothetical protein